LQDVILTILGKIGEGEKSKEDITDLLSIKDVRYVAGALDVLVELGILKRRFKGPSQLHSLSEKGSKLTEAESTIAIKDRIVVKEVYSHE